MKPNKATEETRAALEAAVQSRSLLGFDGKPLGKASYRLWLLVYDNGNEPMTAREIAQKLIEAKPSGKRTEACAANLMLGINSRLSPLKNAGYLAVWERRPSRGTDSNPAEALFCTDRTESLAPAAPELIVGVRVSDSDTAKKTQAKLAKAHPDLTISITEVPSAKIPREKVGEVYVALKKVPEPLRSYLRQRDSLLQQDVNGRIKTELFFDGMWASTAVALERAGCYDVGKWQLAATIGAEQRFNLKAVIDGTYKSPETRWQENQPLPQLPTCRLQRWTGTDEQGLLMARMVSILRGACNAFAVEGLGFYDEAAYALRQRLMDDLTEVFLYFEGGRRWHDTFYALSGVQDWSDMFEAKELELREPDAAVTDSPNVDVIAGNGAEGKFIANLAYRLQTACDCFGRERVNFEDAHSVRSCLLQYFCRVFADEVKDRPRWQTALHTLGRVPSSGSVSSEPAMVAELR